MFNQAKQLKLNQIDDKSDEILSGVTTIKEELGQFASIIKELRNENQVQQDQVSELKKLAEEATNIASDAVSKLEKKQQEVEELTKLTETQEKTVKSFFNSIQAIAAMELDNKELTEILTEHNDELGSDRAFPEANINLHLHKYKFFTSESKISELPSKIKGFNNLIHPNIDLNKRLYSNSDRSYYYDLDIKSIYHGDFIYIFTQIILFIKDYLNKRVIIKIESLNSSISSTTIRVENV